MQKRLGCHCKDYKKPIRRRKKKKEKKKKEKSR